MLPHGITMAMLGIKPNPNHNQIGVHLILIPKQDVVKMFHKFTLVAPVWFQMVPGDKLHSEKVVFQN